MLTWVLQAFDAMHFNDTLIFEAMLLLDRYYSSNPPPEEGTGGAQRKLLAAVCTALKTGAPIDHFQLTLRQVVTHLGRDQVPFDAVICAELQMLRQLRFQVGTPTAKDFLEALTARLGGDRVASACICLAEFLLQLSLYDASLHYRHPHTILAASVLALALYTFRAPQSAYTALLEDLALHCPELQNHQHLMVTCSCAVYLLWVQSVSGGEQSSFAQHLCKKFSRATFHAASTVAPPAAPPNSIPPVLGWGLQAGSGQDDFDEAIALVHQTVTSEDARWVLNLGERLRGVADISWKVRWVLARHGWSNGRFRMAPDREQLLRDLVRASRERKDHKEKGRNSLGSNASSRSPASTSSTTASSGSSTSGCSSDGFAAQREQRRLQRSASWCGQRSGRVLSKASSPGHPGHRSFRLTRASSRSP
jgi:hypothetical protein